MPPRQKYVHSTVVPPEPMGSMCPRPHVEFGMTLHQHYAGLAFERLVEAHIQGTVRDLSKDIIAHEAASYADAMIAEYERRENQ